MLRNRPVFAAVAVLTLALGIGANTAMFSVMDVMLLRALPAKNTQELVEFVRWHPDGSRMTNLPYAVFQHLRENTSVLSGIFAFTSDSWVFRAGGGSERATVHEVSGGFFSTLGVNPLLGRTITPSDVLPNADHQVVVLSYPFWSRRFGRDPSVVGATVHVNGRPCTVIGVMPASFFGVDRSRRPDMWVPLPPDADEVWVLGRLRPGVSIPQARAQLAPLFQQALESLRDGMKIWPARERDAFLAEKLVVNRATTGTSGLRWQYWEYSNTLKILIGMTGLVLLIACVNLANLLMAGSAARAQEIGIRLALGAQRAHVLWMVMRETLLVLAAGAALGLPAAMAAAQVLRSLLFGLGPSDPVAIICAAATLAGAAALAGSLPARRAATLSPMDALRHE
jgi:hypothetical protein